jgi:hypothetical protein
MNALRRLHFSAFAILAQTLPKGERKEKIKKFEKRG